jgi:hypothetical protein
MSPTATCAIGLSSHTTELQSFRRQYERSAVRVLVEAQCLAWIEVDIDEAYVVSVRVHAVPENVSFASSPDVVTSDPEKQQLVTDALRREAVSIAAKSRLPMPFDMMV